MDVRYSVSVEGGPPEEGEAVEGEEEVVLLTSIWESRRVFSRPEGGGAWSRRESSRPLSASYACRMVSYVTWWSSGRQELPGSCRQSTSHPPTSLEASGRQRVGAV